MLQTTTFITPVGEESEAIVKRSRIVIYARLAFTLTLGGWLKVTTVAMAANY
jgi:hypothetical protein